MNWLQATVVVLALLFVARRRVDCTEGFAAPINMAIWLLVADAVLTLAAGIVTICVPRSTQVGYRVLLGGAIAGVGAALTFGVVLHRMIDICGS